MHAAAGANAWLSARYAYAYMPEALNRDTLDVLLCGIFDGIAAAAVLGLISEFDLARGRWRAPVRATEVTSPMSQPCGPRPVRLRSYRAGRRMR